MTTEAIQSCSYSCARTECIRAQRDALAEVLRELEWREQRDEALLREALYALEYASDMTKPEGLQGCGCPICTNITALRERLGEGNIKE